MSEIKIERPCHLSLLYYVTDDVYEAVLQSCSKYSYTGLGAWNELASNFILSSVSYGTIQTILSNHGAMHTTSHMDTYEFILGVELIKTMEEDRPRRDWPTVYADLVAAGFRNRAHNTDNAVDWVLDGVIINKESVYSKLVLDEARD